MSASFRLYGAQDRAKAMLGNVKLFSKFYQSCDKSDPVMRDAMDTFDISHPLFAKKRLKEEEEGHSGWSAFKRQKVTTDPKAPRGHSLTFESEDYQPVLDILDAMAEDTDDQDHVRDFQQSDSAEVVLYESKEMIEIPDESYDEQIRNEPLDRPIRDMPCLSFEKFSKLKFIPEKQCFKIGGEIKKLNPRQLVNTFNGEEIRAEDIFPLCDLGTFTSDKVKHLL